MATGLRIPRARSAVTSPSPSRRITTSVVAALLLGLALWLSLSPTPTSSEATLPPIFSKTRSPTTPLPPNLIVILTDDQDVYSLPLSERVAPNTKHLIVDRGVSFSRAFANTPVCCPSRATLLTGRYAHQPGMTISNRVNCGGAAFRMGPEKDSLAVRLQAEGYHTLYAGKYLNTYGTGDPPTSYVPPGWSEWYGLVGNSRYWNYTLSDEGVEVRVGDVAGAGDYLTDDLARRAVRFIRRTPLPFLLWVAPPAAHAGFSPAPRHRGVPSCAANVSLPRTPAFNHPGRDKHEPIRSAPRMTLAQIAETEEIARARCETMASVDELVRSVFAALAERGLDRNTFVVFTSDHGFHLGQFKLGFDKRQPYEFDVRVPFAVVGPGIPAGRVSSALVSHVDLAPTLLDLAGGDVPPAWDGASFKKELFGPDGPSPASSQSPTPPSSQLAPKLATPRHRELVLIEYRGEGETLNCGAERSVFRPDLGRELLASPARYISAPCDAWNNTFACVRGDKSSFLAKEFLYCEFQCFVKRPHPGRAPSLPERLLVECDEGTPEALGEFYDLDKDPHQLHNAVLELNPLIKIRLHITLLELASCRGGKSCGRAAGVVPTTSLVYLSAGAGGGGGGNDDDNAVDVDGERAATS